MSVARIFWQAMLSRISFAASGPMLPIVPMKWAGKLRVTVTRHKAPASYGTRAECFGQCCTADERTCEDGAVLMQASWPVGGRREVEGEGEGEGVIEGEVEADEGGAQANRAGQSMPLSFGEDGSTEMEVDLQDILRQTVW